MLLNLCIPLRTYTLVICIKSSHGADLRVSLRDTGVALISVLSDVPCE